MITRQMERATEKLPGTDEDVKQEVSHASS